MSAVGPKGAAFASLVRDAIDAYLAVTPDASRSHSTRRSVHCRTSRPRPGTSRSVAKVAVDTDVFVDHLRGARRFDPGRDTVHYSVVTRAELYAGRGSQELAVSVLLAPFREVPVQRSIAERAGRLTRGSALRMPDALIAASAPGGGLPARHPQRQGFRRRPRPARARESGRRPAADRQSHAGVTHGKSLPPAAEVAPGARAVAQHLHHCSWSGV